MTLTKAEIFLYIKAFLIGFIIYGIIQFGVDFFGKGSIDLKFTLIGCTFFGLIIAFFMVPRHIQELKEKGGNLYDPKHVNPKQVRVFQTSLNLLELEEMLKNDPIFKNMEMKFKDHMLVLKSQSGLYSKVVTIESLNDQEIKVISKPKYWFTYVDAGRNIENIRRIYKLINSNPQN